jgi:polysaccharide transporter, PST family
MLSELRGTGGDLRVRTEKRTPSASVPITGGRLTREVVRSRAVSGSVLLSLRGLGLQLVGLGATVVVARYLAPAELGKVAFGLALTTFLAFVGGTQGMAGTLIRRRESPDRAELEVAVGMQLAVGLVIAGVATLVTLPFGEVGRLTALMVWAIPLAAFEVPASVVLERELAYGRIVAADVVEYLSYQGWTICTIVIGWGVWGLASATIFRAVVGAVAIMALSPVKLVRPRFARERARRLLRLGLRIQAVELVDAIALQGINSGTAALGGLSTLGLWTMAYRALQVPQMLFGSMFRVSFPAMSRIVGLGEDPKPVMERFLRLVAPAGAFLLIPLAASSPVLFGSVLGPKWAGAAAAVPPACLGILVLMPISLAGVGYLWSIGDGDTPLWSTIHGTIVWFALTLPLVRTVGVAGVGLGMLGSSVVQATIIVRGVRKHVDIAFTRPVVTTSLLAAAAFVGPWVVARQAGQTLSVAVLAAFVALAGYAILLVVTQRSVARELASYLARVVHLGGGGVAISGAPANP